MFLQVLDELAQVLAAVVLQDIDELRHVAENVGGHGRLPVDVVDQVLDEVAKGKFLFVVLQPDDRDGVPVVGLFADGEMGFGVVVGFVAVFGVDDKVAGDGAGEGVGFEILDAAGPPQFGVGDRVFPGADIDHLVIEANKGVQLRSLRVTPDRDQFCGRDSHEGQFSVVEVGLKPCNTGLHSAFPQGLDLPAEGLVEDVVQGVAVGTVLRVHGEGLSQKVVRLLVDQLLQNRVFDPGIRPVRDVVRLPLDVGPVSVIGFGLDHVRVLFGRLELAGLRPGLLTFAPVQKFQVLLPVFWGRVGPHHVFPNQFVQPGPDFLFGRGLLGEAQGSQNTGVAIVQAEVVGLHDQAPEEPFGFGADRGQRLADDDRFLNDTAGHCLHHLSRVALALAAQFAAVLPKGIVAFGVADRAAAHGADSTAGGDSGRRGAMGRSLGRLGSLRRGGRGLCLYAALRALAASLAALVDLFLDTAFAQETDVSEAVDDRQVHDLAAVVVADLRDGELDIRIGAVDVAALDLLDLPFTVVQFDIGERGGIQFAADPDVEAGTFEGVGRLSLFLLRVALDTDVLFLHPGRLFVVLDFDRTEQVPVDQFVGPLPVARAEDWGSFCRPSFPPAAPAKAFLGALLGQVRVVGRPEVLVQLVPFAAALQFGVDGAGGDADFLRNLSSLRAGGVKGRDRLSVRIFDSFVTFSHVFTVLSLGGK